MEDNEIIVDTVTELDDTVGKVDVVEGLCDESTQACDQLSDIAETITETGKEPSETTVKVAEIAVEAICARLGIKAATKVSFESYAISAESVVEKIKEVGKKIWDSLVKAFKWVLEKIEHIYSVITKNRSFLLKRLNAQQKKVDELPDDADVKEKTVKGSSAVDFGLNGKTDAQTAKTIITNTAKLLLVAKKGNDVIESYINKFRAYTEKMFNLKGAEGLTDGLTASLLDDILKMLDFMGKTHQKGDKSVGHLDNYYSNLLGGTQVRLYAIRGPVKIAIVKTAKSESKTAEVLSKQEMQEVLSASIRLIEELQKFDATLAELKKQSKECAAYCIKRYADSNGLLAKSENHPGSDKAIANALYTLNGLISKLTLDMPVSVFKTAAAAARYVDASMRIHGQPVKADNTYNTPILA